MNISIFHKMKYCFKLVPKQSPTVILAVNIYKRLHALFFYLKTEQGQWRNKPNITERWRKLHLLLLFFSKKKYIVVILKGLLANFPFDSNETRKIFEKFWGKIFHKRSILCENFRNIPLVQEFFEMHLSDSGEPLKYFSKLSYQFNGFLNVVVLKWSFEKF